MAGMARRFEELSDDVSKMSMSDEIRLHVLEAVQADGFELPPLGTRRQSRGPRPKLPYNVNMLPSLHRDCQALASKSQGSLNWERDARFGCMAAAFDAKRAKQVRAWVREVAQVEWTHEEIASAPEQVQRVATRFGLRMGQALFTSIPDGVELLYAAWWPWGGGQRISLRVGVSGFTPDELAACFEL